MRMPKATARGYIFWRVSTSMCLLPFVQRYEFTRFCFYSIYLFRNPDVASFTISFSPPLYSKFHGPTST